MVAVAAHDASSLTFRHLAAALQVEIENPMNESIYIDSVVVEAANACLNGDASFTIVPSTIAPSTLVPSITAPSAASPSYFERSVRISFPGRSGPGVFPGSLASGALILGNSSRDVQIPLPPLPDGTQLTVRVYGKTALPMGSNSYPLVGRQGNSGANIEKFTFQRQAPLTADLGRTALFHARAAIRPDGHLLDEEGSISRLSVFSLADNKQVLFRRDCTTGNYTPSMADIQYLTTKTSRAEARFLRLDFAMYRCLIIFPDGTTMASVRSNLGSVPDDKFNNYNGDPDPPSTLFHDFATRELCNTHGYLFIKTGTNSTRNYYKLSNGFMTGSGNTVDEYLSYGVVQDYEVDFKAESLIGS